ncbi:MAG: type II toxin-antitoxin system VapC family toxin [Propylenella sp.]
MAEAVLDSSAIMAVIRAERGVEAAAEAMPQALVSVVNEAEVIGVLIRYGSTPEGALNLVLNLPYRRIDLDAGLARRAGMLWRDLRPRGLSLGDRCCLALAERERLPVLTTDQRWVELPLDVEVRLLRSREVAQ